MILEAILAVSKMRLKISRRQDLFKGQASQIRTSFFCTVIFKKRSKETKLKQFALSGLQISCVVLQEYPT